MKKGYQAILLSAVLMCAVFTFVTIAWAAFSTTLKIGGTATVKAQTWNVYFKSAQVDSTNTTASNVSIDAIGSSTSTITLSSLAAEFDTPGEKAIYDIVIKNGSTFDAKYKTFTAPTIKCKAADGSGSEYTPTTGKADYDTVSNGDYSAIDPAANVCGFITYEYQLKNAFQSVVRPTLEAAGQEMKDLEGKIILDKTSTTSAVTEVDLVLTIYFDKSKTMASAALPTKDVTVTISDLKTEFEQA